MVSSISKRCTSPRERPVAAHDALSGRAPDGKFVEFFRHLRPRGDAVEQRPDGMSLQQEFDAARRPLPGSVANWGAPHQGQSQAPPTDEAWSQHRHCFSGEGGANDPGRLGWESAGRDDSFEFVAPLTQEPLMRTLAQPMAPGASAPVPPAAVLDDVAMQLLRRVSAGATARGGAVRLEFGSGALAGGSVVVTSDDGQLTIEVDAPAGVDASVLSERLGRRLRARGLRVLALECR